MARLSLPPLWPQENRSPEQAGQDLGTSSPGTAVNHPQHYNSHPSGVECIDIVEWMPFNVGNAIKYIWRCDHKGRDVEDLRKAVWYLNREIERRRPTVPQEKQ